MKKYGFKTIVIMIMLAAGFMLTGCGNKEEEKTDDTEKPVVTAEATDTPAPTKEETPTPTPFPEVGSPDYRFVFIDHAKVYERYYSTYYFEFTEPGYYFQGKISKNGFYDTETGNKLINPTKTIIGKKPNDDKEIYYAVMIFMSKEDELVTDNISFQPEIRYRYDASHTTKVQADPFVINAKKEDMDFSGNYYASYPFVLDGHYLIMDENFTGTAYGQPDNDRSKDYAGIEYFLIKLSYEDMDYDSIKKYIKIYTRDENKNLVPYVPPEGFENYIGCFQSTEDGIRYFRITIGLQFPDGLTPGEQSAIAEIAAKNMILMLSPGA